MSKYPIWVSNSITCNEIGIGNGCHIHSVCIILVIINALYCIHIEHHFNKSATIGLVSKCGRLVVE